MKGGGVEHQCNRDTTFITVSSTKIDFIIMRHLGYTESYRKRLTHFEMFGRVIEELLLKKCFFGAHKRVQKGALQSFSKDASFCLFACFMHTKYFFENKSSPIVQITQNTQITPPRAGLYQMILRCKKLLISVERNSYEMHPRL